MDAVLLQGDELGLPQHIVDEILEEEVAPDESCCCCEPFSSSTPKADQNPDPSCPCRDGACMAGFFPSSAVFINEHQVVLLDGKSGCLKRCVCTFSSNSGEDGVRNYDTFHFSEIEVIPEAFHRRWGGTLGSDRFVLRKDGAAVGVTSGTLCIYPWKSNVEARTALRFRNTIPAEKYVSLHLSRLIQRGIGADCRPDGGVLFALANRTGRSLHQKQSRSFDLRRIYLKSGATIDVGEDVTSQYTNASAPGPSDRSGNRSYLARRTATKVAGPWENLPADVKVQSFLDLGDDNVFLLGASDSRSASDGGSGTRRRDICLFRGSIGMDERGAPTVSWSNEPVVRPHENKDGAEELAGVSDYLCIHDEVSSGEDDILQNELGNPFYTSANNGASWSQPGFAPSVNVLCGGKDGMPAVMAISTTGKLFAFGYDPVECRSAERKRLMGLTGSKNKQKPQWPSLRVYQWSE